MRNSDISEIINKKMKDKIKEIEMRLQSGGSLTQEELNKLWDFYLNGENERN